MTLKLKKWGNSNLQYIDKLCGKVYSVTVNSQDFAIKMLSQTMALYEINLSYFIIIEIYNKTSRQIKHM